MEEREQNDAELLRWAEVLLKSILRMLLLEFADHVKFERYIMKDRLYRRMSYWRRYSKAETRAALQLMSRRHPGVVFSNRGLFIPKDYLKPERGIFDYLPPATSAPTEETENETPN